jgi:flagellar hook assembly protein FlgD
VDLAFELASDGSAKVRIHDVSGRLVRVLSQGRMAAGPQSLRWDRRTQSGARAPAGLYFVEVRSDRETFRQRFVLTD